MLPTESSNAGTISDDASGVEAVVHSKGEFVVNVNVDLEVHSPEDNLSTLR
jgi:hypothetical protein